ncbi:MAG: anti-sigma factor family protein [Acidimicrobiales bacterium]
MMWLKRREPGLLGPGGHLGDWLSPLADHELSPSQEDQANAHVSRCPQCAGELASIENVRRLVRRLESIRPPLEVTADLGPAEPPHRWRAWAAAAAIGAASIGGSIALSAPWPGPGHGSRPAARSGAVFGPGPRANTTGSGSWTPIAIPMGFGP